jgi:RNA polymerase sigma factor (sigma-70 family)
MKNMLNDQQIIDGFRNGNSYIYKHYFYDYCQVAYYMFDKKYGLSNKENLDFMSLAHQYALYLMEHDWKPLEDRAPSVSLRTWMVNGFRYIVLDALKWYKREYGSLSFEDYIKSFDISSNLRLNFNKLILELSETMHLDRKSKFILVSLLVDGFKTKEIAEQLGISPAAVSQRFNTLKEQILIPYFHKYFDMDFDMAEVMDVEMDGSMITQRHLDVSRITLRASDEMQFSIERVPHPTSMPEPSSKPETLRSKLRHLFNKEKKEGLARKRTTPEFITELAPSEIFVFGSNLRGIHVAGAANTAIGKFGAVMGQGVGLQGRSYAIPTMQGGVETIRPYVDDFVQFALKHQDLTFLVTRIGCGIAGFNDRDMAPLFVQAHGIDNIILPEGW